MRDYEIVYIFDTTLGEERVGELVEQFNDRLTAGGGEVTAVDHWGKRRLAYPIDERENGYYVVVQFTADSETLPDAERVIKLEEGLLRHLLVVNEGEPTGPTSPGLEDKEEGEDEAEDEEDEDEDEEEEEEEE